ncbi:hypothetical protein ACFHWS_27455, partial [Micromonospora sp. LOL_013]|uniref:hypothetical protein n=1 Tax=Micromonospora sp. LOL_013 TaxID=3345414 RepID=UPI003A8AEFC1
MVRARWARRAATVMIRVRMVAGLAVDQVPAARCPAARVRLCVIAARVSAADDQPGGRLVSGAGERGVR